jgi:hypothetical protein
MHMCVCVHIPSLHKCVTQACRVPLIFHTIKHKFTVITSCNKYTDAGRENRGSVKDTLQRTFQHNPDHVSTLHTTV